MDQKDEKKDLKDQVISAVLEVIKPIADDVKALGEKVAATDAKMSALDREAVRVDATGKTFKWAGGEAPAQVKGGRGDSKPLMVSNIVRAIMAGGGIASRPALETFAKEELAISERLERAGYQTASLGGILYPLGADLLMEPVNDKGEKVGDISILKKEIAEREHISCDPGELAWMAKRHPEVAKYLGLTRKDLALGDDTLGGFLVPATQADRVIDLLRARAVLIQAGATEVPLPPSGNIAYPRLNSDPSFAFTDPDASTDITTSNIGTGMVRLSAKSLRGAVTIPNDLLRYSGPSVEMLVRSALASKSATAEDNAFLENPGSSVAPKGLIFYTAQSAGAAAAYGKLTQISVTGNTFSPENVMHAIGLYYTSKDPDPATGWIMRPMLWANISNRRADAVSAGDGKGPFMFWASRGSMGEQVPAALGGYPVYPTVQITLDRGSSQFYAFFANWRRMLIGRSGVVELAVSEHVKFLQDKTIIRAVLRSDMGLEHEESFVLADVVSDS